MLLSRKLPILVMIALASINLLVMGLAGQHLWQTHEQAINKGLLLSDTLSQAITSSLRVRIDKIDLTLKAVVYDLENHIPASSSHELQIEQLLQRYESWLPLIANIRITDAQGTVRYGQGVKNQTGASYSDRDFFVGLRDSNDDSLWISHPIIGKVSKQHVIAFVRRYRDAKGRFAGIISAAVPIERFTELLAQFPVDAKSTVVLRHTDLGLIARYPAIPDRAIGQVGNTQMPADLREFILSGANEAHIASSKTLDHVDRLISFKRVGNAPMVLSVGLATETFLHDWYTELTITSVLLVVCLVTSTLFAGYLLKSLRRLHHSEELHRQLFEHSPTGIVYYDRDLIVSRVNSYFGNIMQLPPDYMQGLDCHKLKDQRIIESLEAAIQGKDGYYEGEYITTRDGYRLWISMTCAPLRDNRGEIIGGVGILTDISHQVLARQALEHANLALAETNHQLEIRTQEAESAYKLKSQFLDTVSHELRTPLNAILGMAQLLQMPGMEESERQEYSGTILSSGKVLLKLLNEILDMSKIEAGRMPIVRESFDTQELLQHIAALYSGSAQAKNLSLRVTWQTSTWTHYCGDPTRIEQILGNLVTNAIKFTFQGSIEVIGEEIGERNDESTEAMLRFTVRDSGIGISPEDQSKLFQPFSQVDSSHTRQFGGTGLGLSIVRRLAEHMGGEAGMHSVPDQGSTFWFTVKVGLPIKGNTL